MANGDGGIAVVLLEHELSHGLAHNVAAAQNDTFLSARTYIIVAQKGENAQWCCRYETRQTNRHATDVDGMESVDILPVVDSHNDFLLIDMIRQWKLNDKAVDVGIVVELVYAFQKFLLGDIVLITNQRRLETTLLTSNDLVLDIGFRTAVMPHENSSEMGTLFSARHHLLHLLGNLSFHGRSRCFSIY